MKSLQKLSAKHRTKFTVIQRPSIIDIEEEKSGLEIPIEVTTTISLKINDYVTSPFINKFNNEKERMPKTVTKEPATKTQIKNIQIKEDSFDSSENSSFFKEEFEIHEGNNDEDSDNDSSGVLSIKKIIELANLGEVPSMRGVLEKGSKDLINKEVKVRNSCFGNLNMKKKGDDFILINKHKVRASNRNMNQKKG